MKKTLTLLIVLLIAILFGWLWRGEQRQEISPINEVSFKADDELKPPPAAKPSRPNLPAPEVLAEPNREPEMVRENKQFSYLRVYRLYRSLLYCDALTYYRINAKNEQQPSVEAMLRHHMANLVVSREMVKFSDSQLEHFGHYIEQCKADFTSIEALLELNQTIDGYNAFEIQAELFQLLLKYPAKTDKEKKIKQTLNDKKDWLEAVEAVLYIYERASSDLTDEQVAQLESEITEHQQSIRRASYEELKEHYRQMQQKIELLSSHKHLDGDLSEQLWGHFEQATLQLHEQLKTNDPDVLLEVSQMVDFLSKSSREIATRHQESYYRNNSAYYQATQKAIISKVDINAMLLRQTNIQESMAVKSVAHYAWNMYYCHLGGDCGSQSQIMTSMCVGKLLNNNYFPESCDMNMTDFYIDRLISPNRLQDVQFFFDSLVKKYGS